MQIKELFETVSDEFQQWFRQSKVVDRTGKPLVVYHGSPDVRGILQHGFKPSSHRGDAYFFTDNAQVANTYADDRRAFDYQNAEPHVLPMYLSLQNPLLIDAKKQKWRETERHIQLAKDHGHDGLIIQNTRDEYNMIKTGGRLSTVYVVFSPLQIKSALTTNLRSRIDQKELKWKP